MEKLKEFVSLFGLYFDCCTAVSFLVKMHAKHRDRVFAYCFEPGGGGTPM